MADEPASTGPSGLSPSGAGTGTAATTTGGRPGRSSSGKGVVAFLQASWAELQRVRWPDGRQVGQGTVVVLVFTVIAGLILGAVDAGASRLIDLVI